MSPYREKVAPLSKISKRKKDRKEMTKTAFYNIPSFISVAFDKSIELLPSVDELFEIELAYLEFNCLSKERLAQWIL
jgi:hypothetical protein